MTPEALFLDAGGVLVHPDWSRIAAVLQRHGIDVDGAALRAAEPAAKRRLDLEHVIQATSDASRATVYYELVLAGAGVRAEPEAVAAAWHAIRHEHQARNLWDQVPAEVPAALARLRRRGIPMAVVSNSNGTVGALLEEGGLAGFFDSIVDSGREGVEKPDPRLFHIALERVGARAEATLHVGDLYHVDVAGARAAGITGWLLDPAGLYPEADCERVRSLSELAARLG